MSDRQMQFFYSESQKASMDSIDKMAGKPIYRRYWQGREYTECKEVGKDGSYLEDAELLGIGTLHEVTLKIVE